MTTATILYLLAAITLFFGAAVDPPRFNVTRCIALALGLVVLAQIVGSNKP